MKAIQTILSWEPRELDPVEALPRLVAEVVRVAMKKSTAADYVASWSRARIHPEKRDRFIESVESELLALHEGNLARYRISPSEFEAWRIAWEASN